MADAIVIQVKLAPQDIPLTAKAIGRELKSSLDAAVPNLRATGKKLAEAISAGIGEGLRGAANLKRQLDNVLSPDQRHSTAEQKERAHARRIETIRQQSAAAIQQIEARKQAQIDVIRERAVQREIEQQRRVERAAQSGAGGFEQFLRRYSSRIREAGESIQQAGFAFTSFITGPLVNLGRAAVRSAIDLDRQVNVLRALTGSAEQAEKRFAQLVATAQRSPGLTTGLAATLDTQLRTLNVTERTINSVLPAIGKLNAVAPLEDPSKFVGNLVQLITQNFERQDLKELVGQSPLAGELIKQIFDVSDPKNAQAIRESAKRLGITTVEEFFTRFAEAAANNPKLAAVQESLGTAFEKLRDRVLVALRPLGLTLIETITPLVERLVPIVEGISEGFARLPESVRQAIIVFAGLAAAIGPVLIAAGGVIQAFGALGDLAVVVAGSGGLAAVTAALGPLAVVVAAVAAEVAVLGAAFATNFGGIRTVVLDVINFISSQFNFVKKAISDNGVEIEKLKIQFAVLSKEAEPIIRSLGTLAKNEFALAIRGAIIAAEVALKAFNITLETTISLFRTVKSAAGQVGNALESFGNILTPGLNLGTRTRNALSRPFQGVIVGGNPPSSPLSTGDALRLLAEDMNKLIALDPRLNRARARIGGGGASIAGSSSRRATFPSLTVDDLVSSEFEGIEDFNAIAAARFRGRISRAELTAAFEAAERAEQLRQGRLTRAALTEDFERQEEVVKKQTQALKALKPVLSDSERFMRGFSSAIETTGDAFERLGTNIANSFRDVGSLLTSLKNSLLGFFNDVLGQSLQRVFGQVLGPIAGLFGGGGLALPGGGSIFRTPPTFPASISATQQAQQFLTDIAGVAGPATRPRTVAGAAASSAIRGGFSLAGFAGSLASAAPLLGLALGTGLGGQSRLGQVLGAGAGLGLGLGISFAAPLLAEGGLAALGPAALAFAGPAAFIAAPLIVGAIFAGKAAQRRKDEEASGQFLTQALNAIEELATAISTDQLDGTQARAIFDNQILGTFKQQINTLKTESVRKSRLTNQVRDLENVYQARIPPLIADQQQRRANQQRFAAIDSRLIPQFAIGGVSGGGLAILHPNEMVLTPAHQAAMRFIAGPDVFERIGVPGVQQQPVFDRGGIMPTSASGPVIVINNLTLLHGMSQSGAEELFLAGGSGPSGERLIVKHMQSARLNRRI